MISTVVLFKDEHTRIGQCLQSLQWCDDIMVVLDSAHVHPLAEIPKLASVRVVSRLLESDFSKQRMYGMECAKHEWVLFVDADEVVSETLASEIQHTQLTHGAYRIPRIDFFWNTKLTHGEVAQAATHGLIRLVKKGSGSWQGSVHEVFEPTSSIGSLRGQLLHTPHQTISEFIAHINQFSSIRAIEVSRLPVWVLTLQLIVYPPAKFWYTYLLKGGFLDGPAGFAYSFIMAFHSFLVRAKAITHS